jgi:hypothetical protein
MTKHRKGNPITPVVLQVLVLGPGQSYCEIKILEAFAELGCELSIYVIDFDHRPLEWFSALFNKSSILKNHKHTVSYERNIYHESPTVKNTVWDLCMYTTNCYTDANTCRFRHMAHINAHVYLTAVSHPSQVGVLLELHREINIPTEAEQQRKRVIGSVKDMPIFLQTMPMNAGGRTVVALKKPEKPKKSNKNVVTRDRASFSTGSQSSVSRNRRSGTSRGARRGTVVCGRRSRNDANRRCG